MKQKRTKDLGIAFVALVFMTMSLIPVVGAFDFSANETQIQTMNTLQGQDISLGELYENVQPELMADLPKGLQETLYSTKVVWPDYANVSFRAEVDPAKTGEQETRFSKTGERDIIPVILRHISDISASGRKLDYRSESWVVFPPYLKMPYGGITTALYKMDSNGQTGTLVAFSAKTVGENGVDNLKAEKSMTVSEAGDYFCQGVHYFTAPPGYTPAEDTKISQSEVVTVA